MHSSYWPPATEVEEWFGGELVGRPERGTKNPVFLDCEDGESTRRDVLVKPSDSGAMQAREYLGNQMARAFGLKTPAPVVVTLDEASLDTLRNEYLRRGWFIGSTLSQLAGSYKVALGANLPLTTDLPVDLLPEATRLFAFDMLSHYADRTDENPNCSWIAEGLLVFDFEQCFPAEPRLMQEGPVWAPCARGLAMYHCLYQHVRGKSQSLQFLDEATVRLSGDGWRRLVDGLPIEWQPEAHRILSHTLEIATHLAEFRFDLEKALK